MKNPFISDGDSYVYDSDNQRNDDNISISCGMQNYSDEGQYSIVRNEVRSTWPKRRPKYQKPHESMINDVSIATLGQFDSQDHSPIDGSISDIICRDVDLNLNNLKDSLATLTQKFEDVSAEKLDKTNLDRRLMEENQNLQAKIKIMEQQIVESHSNTRQDCEKLRQNNELEMKRIVTLKNQEIEECLSRISILENETSNQRITCLARKNEVDKLYYEMVRLKEKIGGNEQQYATLLEEFVRFQEITNKENDIYNKERDFMREAVLEIQKENTITSSSHMLIPLAEQQMNGLQNLVQKLSQDNRMLRENLEELQGELLTISLEEGRSLLLVEDNSWASESNSYTKTELINFILKEKDVNFKLRQYSDKLISKIIEGDPSILEI